MAGTRERTTGFLRRSAGFLVLALVPGLEGVTALQPGSAEARQRERIEQAQRLEGEAMLLLADAAMSGKPVPSDFEVTWHNDFLKAQRGTFVPFTLTVDTSRLSRPTALVYVRAARRASRENASRDADRKRRERDRVSDEADAAFPVDAIFPVDLKPVVGRPSRVSRGFSIPPGEYDVYVVMRERIDPDAQRSQPKASVLRQSISVPDFWSDELTTSTVILADRLNTLKEPVPAEQLAERPYVIGQNDITPAADRAFRKDEELIVVFLVYNPTVTAGRQFDVLVEYHFFRRGGGGAAADPGNAVVHPPEREGEKYYNHTDPQRFNPALMGPGFDPRGAQPVMAGQVVPLGGFLEGEYRLAILITDVLAGKSISRDVQFTVGSSGVVQQD